MLKNWLETIGSSIVQQHQHYFGVQAINESQKDIDTWFSSLLGQRMLVQQKEQIDHLLADMFGYHLMQLSVLDNTRLLSESPTTHQFSVIPFTQDKTRKACVHAEFERLPIESNAIDVALLHHALDFSVNPHQLLRETARVIMPNGHIILVGFNPFSMMGASTPLACMLSKSHFYHRNHLRLARLKDWCKVLELELVYSDKGYFGLPCDRYYTPKMETIGKNLVPFLGGFYVLVLRKSITPMTMVKTTWKKQKVLPKWRKGIATSSVSPSPSAEKILQDNSKNEKS